VSLITISDLTFKAYQMNQTTLRTSEIFTLVLLMYLGISLTITMAVRALEARASTGLVRGRAG
jgi:polar amino acid transport system permease protein